MHLQPDPHGDAAGPGRTGMWVVEFEQESARQVDPLMGWTSSNDTRQQVRLEFATQEAALAYCEKRGLEYSLRAPQQRRVRPKAYADNFRWNRVSG